MSPRRNLIQLAIIFALCAGAGVQAICLGRAYAGQAEAFARADEMAEIARAAFAGADRWQLVAARWKTLFDQAAARCGQPQSFRETTCKAC